jgi:hypothetical protein
MDFQRSYIVDSYIKAEDPSNFNEVSHRDCHSGRQTRRPDLPPDGTQAPPRANNHYYFGLCLRQDRHLHDMEDFPSVTNVADILVVGERCFDIRASAPARCARPTSEEYIAASTSNVIDSEAQLCRSNDISPHHLLILARRWSSIPPHHAKRPVDRLSVSPRLIATVLQRVTCFFFPSIPSCQTNGTPGNCIFLRYIHPFMLLDFRTLTEIFRFRAASQSGNLRTLFDNTLTTANTLASRTLYSNRFLLTASTACVALRPSGLG